MSVLAERVALVTGASRGVGAALAADPDGLDGHLVMEELPLA